MTDHSDPKGQQPQSLRIESFLRQERQGGVYPAIKALHARPNMRPETTNRRAVEFARIDRGREV